MTISKGASAAIGANTGRGEHGPCGGAKVLCQTFVFLLFFFAFAHPLLAESIHVAASADPKQSATQGRQQALERALLEAVYREALRVLPTLPSEERLSALRAYLAPHALDYVLSYQESAPAQPDQTGDAKASDSAPTVVPAAVPVPTSATVTLEMDVTVQRAYLRSTLVRLGFFAGVRHPGTYQVRLGAGVKEKDLQPLAKDDILLGLVRAKQVPPAESRAEVALERLPQGYYKAVLRHNDLVFAADATELPALWLNIWGKYFSDNRLQPGPGKQILTIAGFAGVDAAQDFVSVLGSWDEALQNVSLAGMDIGMEGVSAKFTCRVVSQEALNTRLTEALATRKLTLVSQSGVVAP
jgi:hypothetical protein